MPTYYLGLDVHKVRTQYCLMDPAGIEGGAADGPRRPLPHERVRLQICITLGSR